jgi:outer membrane protein assembly factor BamB
MKVRLLLVLAVVLVVAACGGAGGVMKAAGCTALAQEVSLTGQVRWQAVLGTGLQEGAAGGRAAAGELRVWRGSGDRVQAGHRPRRLDLRDACPQAGATGSSPAAAAGVAGVAVAVKSTPGPARLYLLDPATGRVRWQAAALVGAGPMLTAAGVTDIEGTAAQGPLAIVDRDAADGQIRWQDKLPQQFSDAGRGAEQLVAAGQLALVQGNASPGQPATLSAYRLDDGSLAWQTTLPENVADSPDLVPGQGVLVQPDLPFSGCGPVPG